MHIYITLHSSGNFLLVSLALSLCLYLLSPHDRRYRPFLTNISWMIYIRLSAVYMYLQVVLIFLAEGRADGLASKDVTRPDLQNIARIANAVQCHN